MAIDGVTVKPLDWHRVTYGWLAFSEIYRIEDNGPNWPTERFWPYERGVRLGKFDTLEIAKSVVQVLHESRILSALAYETAKACAKLAESQIAGWPAEAWRGSPNSPYVAGRRDGATHILTLIRALTAEAALAKATPTT